MSEMQNQSDIPFTAQDLIVGSIDASISYWNEIGGQGAEAAEEALNLLALWAHLRRFPVETVRNRQHDDLDALIRNDHLRLIEAFAKMTFPEDWADCVQECDDAYDDILAEDSVIDLERIIREQFLLLDCFSLAIYAVDRLGEPAGCISELHQQRKMVEDAEDFFSRNPDLFLSTADYAAALLAAYRVDLDSFDEPLWETTLKHRRLEELLDERKYPQRPTIVKLERIFPANMFPTVEVPTRLVHDAPSQFKERWMIDSPKVKRPCCLPLFADVSSAFEMAAGIASGPASHVIAEGSIVDYPNVEVLITRRRIEGSIFQIVVSLSSDGSGVPKLISAEFEFDERTVLPVELVDGMGAIKIDAAKVEVMSSLVFIDEDTGRHNVVLD